MGTLVAIAYPDVDTARTVAEELAELTKEQSIELDDMVVVERTSEGKVQLHQSRSTPEKVLPRISQFGGAVIQTSLDPDQESELQAALGGQGTAV